MAAGRLSGRVRCLAAAAAAVLLALPGGGCSYRLGGFFDDKAEQTGSVKPAKATEPAASAALPPDQDLAFTRAAVHDGAESWLQGEACRIHHGKWEVKALRRLKRT